METELNLTPEIEMICDLLDQIEDLIDETPPLPVEPGALRFGNKAYTAWFEKKDNLILEKLPLILGDYANATVEGGVSMSKTFPRPLLEFQRYPKNSCSLSLRELRECD